MIRLASLFALAAFIGSAHAQPAEDVPVERVILFTSGVGYFEHVGRISGNAEVVLQFEEAALNDVLKSLLVEDRGGRVAGVTYPTQAPIERTLRSFAIDLSGEPDLAHILAQARGTELIVGTPTGTIRGTLLSVQEEMRGVADNAASVVTLSLLTPGGIRSLRLDTAGEIAFGDSAIQEEIASALAALAEARGGQRKAVRIRFIGNGSRSVRMGYVIESPVWKTSYRLSLPTGVQGDGQLQGWALIENPTESDWSNIDLTLVSGRPVSFVQDLYTPRYVQRPVVELPDDAVVRPQQYDAGVGGARRSASGAPPPAPPSPSPAVRSERPMIQSDAIGSPRIVSGDDISLAVGSVQASATSGDFGELFAYRLGDVTLPRRGSAMLPIVTEAVTAERLSIWSNGGTGRNPMRGVRLTNTTDKSLRGGPMTVLDDGYAGDALLPDLPSGAERLLTFAVDQDVLVDQYAVPNAAGTIETASIRDGVLMIRRQARVSRGYRVENRGSRAKSVLIEHPRQSGSELIEPASAEESTPGLYRIKVDLPAGEVDSIRVVEARTTNEGIALVSSNPDQLAALARADGNIPENVRRAIRDAVEKRRELARTEQQMQALQGELNQIEQDQARIRGNLEAVDNNTDYGRRLLNTLNEQETRIEQIRSERSRLEAQASSQRAALTVTVQ